MMKIKVCADAVEAAQEAAAWIAAEANSAIAARGRFVLAVSGGRTPWLMMRALALQKIDWKQVHLFQVDERIAPANSSERNLLHLRECLVEHGPLAPEQLHAMPVESPDLDAAAAQYSSALREVAGSPPVLDVVHLGLGEDGHTASLVPGDPVLDVADADVALTGTYQGRRRMTLTYPVIGRTRRVLWLVTGSEKAEMLVRLYAGDDSIPAGRVRRDGALLLADRASAARLPALGNRE